MTVVSKGAYGVDSNGFTICRDLAYATIDAIADQVATGDELQPAPRSNSTGNPDGRRHSRFLADNVGGTASIV
ncbi:MAG: hypothetical protein ACLT98_09890 [Eggerthellaceae bacterium]